MCKRTSLARAKASLPTKMADRMLHPSINAHGGNISISEISRHFNVVLKDKQVEAIQSFMNGREVFVALPTGYGKSLIYAFLPSVIDLYKGESNLGILSIIICVPFFRTGR